MEETKAIPTLKFTLIKTRNSEFKRYQSNVKTLFVRIGDGDLSWRGQHENAQALERHVLTLARLYQLDVSFSLRTGTGIVVETGRTIHTVKGA